MDVEELVEDAEKLRLTYAAQSGDQLVFTLLRGGHDVEAQRYREDQVDQTVRSLREKGRSLITYSTVELCRSTETN